MSGWEYEICPKCDGHGGGEWGGRPCGYPGCHRRDGVFQVPVGRVAPAAAGASAPPPQVVHVTAAPARPSLIMQILSRRGGRRGLIVAFLGLAWLIWFFSLPVLGGVLAVLALSLTTILRAGPELASRVATVACSALTLGVAGIWFLLFGVPEKLRGLSGPGDF